MYMDFLTNSMPAFSGGMTFDGGNGSESTTVGDTVDLSGSGLRSGMFTPTSLFSGVVNIGGGILNIMGLDRQPSILNGPVSVTAHGFGRFTYQAPAGDDSMVADAPAAGQTRLGLVSSGEAMAGFAFYGNGTIAIGLRAANSTSFMGVGEGGL